MGTSITITDLDFVTFQRLETEARRRGMDVATLARELLRKSAPPTANSATTGMHHDLDSLAGTWSEADARAFRVATEQFERVDRELWK